MSQVIIQPETTKDPISLIGREAGVCQGVKYDDPDKQYKRGMDCIEANHGRALEFPQVYMILDGYSAKVIREFYTHIAGGPTRLQASTRYIDYKDFEYVTPPAIAQNPDLEYAYDRIMQQISNAMVTLESLGAPREDIGMILPLGMETKVVVRTNLRNLMDMSHQRMCTRAFWEYRMLMNNMIQGLSEYSDEWNVVTHKLFMPKCDVCGYCIEKKSCGRRHKKGEKDL